MSKEKTKITKAPTRTRSRCPDC